MLLPIVRKWRGEWVVGELARFGFRPICICESRAAAEAIRNDAIKEFLQCQNQ